MVVITANLPTLYEYYAPNGVIHTGLSTSQPEFTLNNKLIRLYSGAMHYFRIPKSYWRDRLQKLRAAGLNTVETYIPWNLHEPQDGDFNFGNGTSDMNDFLDLQEYLKIAQEEDLFAIVRPGPYICAEWEWGGLPSWLLRKKDLEIRSSNPIFMNFVKRYFAILLPILAALQFVNGGPIIAFQVENEYADNPKIDLNYLQQLTNLFRANNIVELLVSSDDAKLGHQGSLPGQLFQTINFGKDAQSNLRILSKLQPGKPLMVMEFWSGGFDHWGEPRHILSNASFYNIYKDILCFPSSVSLYMFCGGTNFGFLNGADQMIPNFENNKFFEPTTTSYDYNAPLSEAGDYTVKYNYVKELVKKYNPVKTLTPEKPKTLKRIAYNSIPVVGQLQYEDIRKIVPIRLNSLTPITMEDLPINNHSGQSYGYCIYEKNLDIPANTILEIKDYIHDTVIVLINNQLVSPRLTSTADLNGFGFYRLANSSLTLTNRDLFNATLTIIIENWGRVNYGAIYHQTKGLTLNNTLFLNGKVLLGPWDIFPLEFKKSWNSNLTGWKNVSDNVKIGPALYRANLIIKKKVRDTYVNMEGWSKGIIIVNGFVLGRYALIGPQKSLYLPAPFLKIGNNEIIVFEHYKSGKEIKFSTDLLFYDN